MPLQTNSSLHEDTDREPGGGLLTGKFERQMKKCTGYGPSLSMGAKGTEGRDPLLGTLKAT